MTYDEALTVTAMVINAWPTSRPWTEDEMDMYARGLLVLDAATAVATINTAQQQTKHRPSVAELREFYSIERAKIRAQVERPVEKYVKKEKVPLWVRRWVAARYLHRQFGREQDLRRFPEQQGWADPDLELMPPTEWLEEAEHVTDERVWKTLQT